MRDLEERDAEGLLSKEQLSESDFDASSPTWRATQKTWLDKLRAHAISASVITVLSVTNIATLTFLFSSQYAKSAQHVEQPHIPTVFQPPTGVPPTLKSLVRQPVPMFVNITWYPPEDTLFRGNSHPPDEVDEFWKWYDASYGGYLLIPKEEAESADIDPTRHAYVDRPDLGIEGFPVLPEAIHQMHCVNMLRRNLYYNIEHTRKDCHPPNCEPPELESWRIQHVDHCLEIVRNRVACTADLGIVPFMWYGHNGKLAGDMARMKTCNNYEAIGKFVLDNGVLHGETEGLLKPPPGAFITNLRD